MDKSKQYPAEVFSWMVTVAQMPMFYYGTIPLKDLYKVFQSGKDRIPGHDGAPEVAEIDEKEFGKLLRGFLELRNREGISGTHGAQAAGLSCWIDGDEVVADIDPEIVKSIRAEK